MEVVETCRAISLVLATVDGLDAIVTRIWMNVSLLLHVITTVPVTTRRAVTYVCATRVTMASIVNRLIIVIVIHVSTEGTAQASRAIPSVVNALLSGMDSSVKTTLMSVGRTEVFVVRMVIAITLLEITTAVVLRAGREGTVRYRSLVPAIPV